MGESTRTGLDGDAHPAIAIDAIEDANEPEAATKPSFPRGSAGHDLDALLSAYLLDLDVAEPMPGHACVLLVEPDAQIRRQLGEMLEAAGYAVVTATTTMQALAQLDRHIVDLVLTDAAVRDASGVRLRDQLRSRAPGTPVILMSDDPVVAATWSPSDQGAAGFVERPVRGLLLLGAVRDALRQSR